MVLFCVYPPTQMLYTSFQNRLFLELFGTSNFFLRLFVAELTVDVYFFSTTAPLKVKNGLFIL